MRERKNYLKVTIYIVTTTFYLPLHGDYHTQRTPFVNLEEAKLQYEKACAENPQAQLQKLTVKGSPRGVAMAMYVFGRDVDLKRSDEDVFGDQVDYTTLECITEQVGAI